MKIIKIDPANIVTTKIEAGNIIVKKFKVSESYDEENVEKITREENKGERE